MYFKPNKLAAAVAIALGTHQRYYRISANVDRCEYNKLMRGNA